MSENNKDGKDSSINDLINGIPHMSKEYRFNKSNEDGRDVLEEIREGLRNSAYKTPNRRPKEETNAQTGRLDSNGRSITRSEATIRDYETRASQLFTRYRQERGLGSDFSVSDISLIDFSNWALSLKPDIRASTWRFYRRALLHRFATLPVSEDTEEAIRILETDIYNRTKGAGRTFSAQETTRDKTATSSLKMKRVVYADYLKLDWAARIRFRSTRSLTLRRWMRAGLLTGLRPAEWEATNIATIGEAGRERTYLFVINAKATNNRANGLVRTIDITGFPEQDRLVVSQMSRLGRSWFRDGVFAYEKRECGRLLSRISRSLWPNRRNHYSLYSFRHQAVANWKAALSQEEVAALAGHGVTGTASRSYGKRLSSWSGGQVPSIPESVPEEVELVVHREADRQQRLAPEMVVPETEQKIT